VRWPPHAHRVRVGRIAGAVVALAVTAGGCATVPDSGPVQQVGAAQAGVSQEQDYSQPIPVGPGQGWNPAHIVSGFLAASASFANDHHVAREYLDPAAKHNWQPGWAVTVVSTTPTTSPVLSLPKQFSSQSGGLEKVEVTGLRVATLTHTGQYLVSSGSARQSYHFSLIRVGGQWRIDSLPSSLLLTQADFQRVYQPRNIYFLAPSGHTLVPDPVFVPQQATNTELATGLVTALLQDPGGWLSGAAVTGFPLNSRLDTGVRINGPNAIVNLRGKGTIGTKRQQAQMAAQLAWTLATGPTAIQSVELQVNGRPLQIMHTQYQLPQTYHDWLPTQSAASKVFYIGSGGAVRTLLGVGQPGVGQPGHIGAVPGAAGAVGTPVLTTIAVSPDGRSVAGIAGGATVYTASLSPGATWRQWRPPGGKCTSLSWDSHGNLWVAAGGQVWLLPASGTGPALVSLGLPVGSGVTAFRISPDGVRAAMIVQGGLTGSQKAAVVVAGIARVGNSAQVGPAEAIGASIPDPVALSWYGEDDVIVLAGSTSAAELEEVPLNGGQPTTIPTQGDVVSMTATSPDSSTPGIAIGLSNGHIMVSTKQGAFEPTRATGVTPVYPG
jgi:hypothetical protein